MLLLNVQQNFARNIQKMLSLRGSTNGPLTIGEQTRLQAGVYFPAYLQACSGTTVLEDRDNKMHLETCLLHTSHYFLSYCLLICLTVCLSDYLTV